jgi:hypothetical protein
MNNWCICWFFTLFLLGILIFKGFTAGRLYKSFGVKELKTSSSCLRLLSRLPITAILTVPLLPTQDMTNAVSFPALYHKQYISFLLDST